MLTDNSHHISKDHMYDIDVKWNTNTGCSIVPYSMFSQNFHCDVHVLNVTEDMILIFISSVLQTFWIIQFRMFNYLMPCLARGIKL